MDKCIKEKESLYQLRLNGIDKITDSFHRFDSNEDTYFMAYPERNYLMDYYFETLPQLREKLSDIWKNEEYMKDVLKTVLSAAMKNKPVETDDIVRQDIEETIPTYIYNF